MENKKIKSFLPSVSVPPGDSIRENMGLLGMNQEELASRLGISIKHLSNVLNGKSPITYETALSLEFVVGASAQFWMNLESNYQLDKARLGQQAEMLSELEIMKAIPYKKMSDYGWLEKSADKTTQIREAREFYGVAKLDLIKSSSAVAYKKQKPKKNISDLSVLAWLKRAEKEGLAKSVDVFSQKKLKSLIPKFRELTQKDPDVFYPEIQNLCAAAGVALVLVESLPNTYVCGATIWKNDKVIVALSVRGKKADIFWFAFFHELAHLLNHSYKDFHIQFEDNDQEDTQIG